MKNKQLILSLFLLGSLFYGLNGCTDKNRYLKPSLVINDSILSPELLNSEKIRMKFGSYNINVLNESSKLRVSNLYSTHGDKNITRTFAVVYYPENINTAFLKEHLEILDGQSIGKVFKQAQWEIEKKNLYFGEILPSPDYAEIYKLMGHITPSKLAIHTYGFNIRKGNKSYRYAIISEIHHPDYLTFNDLKKIYHNAGRYLDKTAFIKILNGVDNAMKADYSK